MFDPGKDRPANALVPNAGRQACRREFPHSAWHLIWFAL